MVGILPSFQLVFIEFCSFKSFRACRHTGKYSYFQRYRCFLIVSVAVGYTISNDSVIRFTCYTECESSIFHEGLKKIGSKVIKVKM